MAQNGSPVSRKGDVMGGLSIVVGVGLLIVLLAGFVHLRRGRARVMDYHHMPTPAVIPLSHGGTEG